MPIYVDNAGAWRCAECKRLMGDCPCDWTLAPINPVHDLWRRLANDMVTTTKDFRMRELWKL